ncbi:putative LOC107381567-like protein [Nothobranchius furzeri]|uniref:LOC107381567-like protein n=1 Tax=Nothobranchius furzeri TaxID=105023 RepID=A0A9D2Y2D0_NOTFU|nr:putative LOC107381567-like protein [Nothobranchius furzeri]
MAITTCQKVTLISCSVLCVSLFLPGMLLPRRRKEKGQPEGKAAYQAIIHPSPSPAAAAAVLRLQEPAILEQQQHITENTYFGDFCQICQFVCILAPPVGPGFYSSVKHQLPVPDDPDQWDVDSSPSLSHTFEAMAKVMSIQRGKKYNLMAQVIPIYSFGILLYILYIIHKLTNKSKINKPGLYTTVKMTSTRNTASECYLFI